MQQPAGPAEQLNTESSSTSQAVTLSALSESQAAGTSGADYVLTFNQVEKASLYQIYEISKEMERFMSEGIETETLNKLYYKCASLRNALSALHESMKNGRTGYYKDIEAKGSLQKHYGFTHGVNTSIDRKILIMIKEILNCDDLETRWDKNPPNQFITDLELVEEELKRIVKMVAMLNKQVASHYRQYLQSYKEVGKKLGDTQEMIEFKGMLTAIRKGDQGDETWFKTFEGMFANSVDWQPFVMVCSSSGTGKTQIPFTLCQDSKFPLLYMLDKVPKKGTPGDQKIYHPFHAISQKFEELCQRDKAKVQEIMEELEPEVNTIMDGNPKNRKSATPVEHIEVVSGDEPASKRTRTNLSKDTEYEIPKIEYNTVDVFDYMRTENVEFESAGFLCAVFKEIARLYHIHKISNNTDNFDWIDAQLELDVANLPHQATDLRTAASFINDLEEYELPLLKPVIFIDECDTSVVGQWMFVFKSDLIRSLDLIPIIMGTDSKLHKIVKSSNGGCQTRGDNDLWGFVFHKLPQFPLEDIQSLATKIKRDLGDDAVDLAKKEKFIDLIAECATYERPYLVAKTLSFLSTTLKSDEVFEPEERIQMLLHHLYKIFTGKKRISQAFRAAQLAFLQDHYRSIHTLLRTEECSDVNTHLGFIWDQSVATSETSDEQIERIVESSRGVITLSLHLSHGVSITDEAGEFAPFTVNEYFAPFQKAPLSTLAFASSCVGPYTRNLLPPDYGAPYNERLSVRKVVKSIPTSTPANAKTKRDGDILENWCKYALIASLAATGFTRKTMIDWLPRFLAEFEPSYQPDQLSIRYSPEDDVQSAWTKIEMPFCAPISEEWPTNLLRFVQEDCGGLVGRFENTADATKIDGILYLLKKVDRVDDPYSVAKGKGLAIAPTESRPLLTLECKYHNDNITFCTIREIFGKFEAYSAKLQLIIAREFGELADIKKKLTDHVEDRKMYAVYVELGNNNSAHVKLLCGDPRDEEASCLILFPINS